MIIKTKLELKEYIKLMYVLTYRKPMVIIISIIGLVMIIGTLGYFLGFKDMYESAPIVPGALGFAFVILVPFSIYRGAKRNFSSSGRLNETINYEFTEDRIIITGESFTS